MDVKARNGVLEFTLNVKLIFHLEKKTTKCTLHN